MEIAYTVWPYMKSAFTATESSEEERGKFEQGVREVADIGFRNIENFNFTVIQFEDYPEEFERIMRENGTKLVNIYHCLTGDFEKDYALAVRCCDFLNRHGAHLMNLEVSRRNGREATPEAMQEVCDQVNKIADLCVEKGITLCLHPHYWTFCETADQIAFFAEHTDPAKVKFCIDTCHCVLGKMNPCETVEKYADRIAYMHLKDISSDENEHPEFPIKRCRALGEGIVDFRKVHEILKDHGYDGILCVEVDWPRLCNFDTAQISYRYLHDVLRLR